MLNSVLLHTEIYKPLCPASTILPEKISHCFHSFVIILFTNSLLSQQPVALRLLILLQTLTKSLLVP